MDTSLNEREFELINIIGAELAPINEICPNI